ncbi:MAG: hypothetical protein RRY20_09245 [Bilophila sp.]
MFNLIDCCPVLGYFRAMTNFFDIATPEEVIEQFSLDDEPLSPEALAAERRALEKDSDLNLSCLAFLSANRGDEQAVHQYLEQIKNDERRLETSMLLFECQPA